MKRTKEKDEGKSPGYGKRDKRLLKPATRQVGARGEQWHPFLPRRSIRDAPASLRACSIMQTKNYWVGASGDRSRYGQRATFWVVVLSMVQGRGESSDGGFGEMVLLFLFICPASISDRTMRAEKSAEEEIYVGQTGTPSKKQKERAGR